MRKYAHILERTPETEAIWIVLLNTVFPEPRSTVRWNWVILKVLMQISVMVIRIAVMFAKVSNSSQLYSYIILKNINIYL